MFTVALSVSLCSDWVKGLACKTNNEQEQDILLVPPTSGSILGLYR